MYKLPEDREEHEAKFAPLCYACEECGKNFETDQKQCIDTCGGRVLPVYDRADYERD